MFKSMVILAFDIMIINKEFNIQKEILIAFVILFSQGVYAFGVSSVYWEENPLKLSPGETTNINFILQNNIGEQNLSVRADISKGSEILELIDSSNTYFLPYRSEQPKVNVRVKIPENAKIGHNYSIEITFTTLKESTKGALGFGSGIKKKFDVIVIEKPKTIEEIATKKAIQQNIYLIIKIIISAVITAAIIFFVVKKKKAKLRSSEKTIKSKSSLTS